MGRQSNRRPGYEAKHSEGDVSLPERLAEFRQALREEIEAARRAAVSSAVPLVNGRLIGRVGSSFQYAFSIESALSMPTDAPGDLYVPGHPGPVEVAVISIEGLLITLSVAEDLGGFVSHARLQSDLAHLMRKLIERVENYAEKPNPGGDRIIGELTWAGHPEDPILRHSLDPSQVDALRKAIGQDTTFIWGPPGTGKTQTIGRIGAELFARGRSLLVVSHTNAAVDHALLRIAVAESITQEDLQRGAVIRVGDPHDKRVQENPELLLHTHVERRSQALVHELEDLRLKLESLSSVVLELERTLAICEWAKLAGPDIREMERAVDHTQSLELRAAELTDQIDGLRQAQEQIEPLLPSARKAVELQLDIPELEARLEQLLDQLRENEAQDRELREVMTREQGFLALSGELEPLRKRRLELPAIDVSKSASIAATQGLEKSTAEQQEAVAKLAAASLLYDQASSTGGLVRRWKGLPRPEDQAGVVGSLRATLSLATASLDTARQEAAQQLALLTESEDLDRQLLPHEHVRGLKEQTSRLREVEARHASCVSVRKRLQRDISETQDRVRDRKDRLEAAYHELTDAPQVLLDRAVSLATQAKELGSELQSVKR